MLVYYILHACRGKIFYTNLFVAPKVPNPQSNSIYPTIFQPIYVRPGVLNLILRVGYPCERYRTIGIKLSVPRTYVYQTENPSGMFNGLSIVLLIISLWSEI